MYTLKDSQIDFILNDLSARGIKTEDLQYNLLDHICCIIENELGENEDFGQFYQKVISRFFKKELSELEEETQLLLTFKHYYTMKKIMFVSGFSSAIIMLTGSFFKVMHWPGASFLLLLGVLFFSLLFLPLLFTLILKEKKEGRQKGIVLFGLIVSIGLITGALFKMFHWPGATLIGMTSLAVLILLYVPFYLITGIRNPETKVNTAITSILIIAGCAFLLILPGRQKSKKLSDREITYMRNEEKNLNELFRIFPKDSVHSAELNTVMDKASLLKDAIARAISDVNYKDYLNNQENINAKFLTEPDLNNLPETKEFISAVKRFEAKTGKTLYEIPENKEEPQNFESAFSPQTSIQNLMSFITLIQTKACVASAVNAQVATQID
jgi:hypothetical protein